MVQIYVVELFVFLGKIVSDKIPISFLVKVINFIWLSKLQIELKSNDGYLEEKIQYSLN